MTMGVYEFDYMRKLGVDGGMGTGGNLSKCIEVEE